LTGIANRTTLADRGREIELTPKGQLELKRRLDIDARPGALSPSAPEPGPQN